MLCREDFCLMIMVMMTAKKTIKTTMMKTNTMKNTKTTIKMATRKTTEIYKYLFLNGGTFYFFGICAIIRTF